MENSQGFDYIIEKMMRVNTPTEVDEIRYKIKSAENRIYELQRQSSTYSTSIHRDAHFNHNMIKQLTKQIKQLKEDLKIAEVEELLKR